MSTRYQDRGVISAIKKYVFVFADKSGLDIFIILVISIILAQKQGLLDIFAAQIKISSRKTSQHSKDFYFYDSPAVCHSYHFVHPDPKRDILKDFSNPDNDILIKTSRYSNKFFFAVMESES